MRLQWDRRHMMALAAGAIVLIADVIFLAGTTWFVPLIVIALTIGWSQHWIDFFIKSKMDKELEDKFPEFVRNLVSTVKSGMPMTRAILQVSHTDYGALNPYVQKLANQIEWAIPMHRALLNFAQETDNSVIKRAIATVIEAEQSGGNIEDVLESITSSVLEIKKIKQERAASIHGQVVQSYIIFLVFLGVMIAIQNLLIPYISGIASGDDQMGMEIIGAGPGEGGGGMKDLMKPIVVDTSSFAGFVGSLGEWFVSIRGVFLMLAGIQGLFAGLVLGQLSSGSMKSGVKHSLVMVTLAFLVITIAQGYMGGGDIGAVAVNGTQGATQLVDTLGGAAQGFA